MIDYTGHPFFDVGLAALTAFSHKTHPTQLVQADLERVAEYMAQNYVVNPLKSFLTVAFPNSGFTNPAYESQPDKRAAYAEHVLGAFRGELPPPTPPWKGGEKDTESPFQGGEEDAGHPWKKGKEDAGAPWKREEEDAGAPWKREEEDAGGSWKRGEEDAGDSLESGAGNVDPFTGLPAAQTSFDVKGELAAGRAFRQHVPLTTAEGIINFHPYGEAGLPLSGLGMLALQALPLGCAKVQGRLLAVHSDDPRLLLHFARQFLETNRRNILAAQQAGEKKLAEYEQKPRTLLIDLLLQAMRAPSPLAPLPQVGEGNWPSHLAPLPQVGEGNWPSHLTPLLQVGEGNWPSHPATLPGWESGEQAQAGSMRLRQAQPPPPHPEPVEGQTLWVNLTAYHFTNSGQGADLAIYPLPLEVGAFLDAAIKNPKYRLAWEDLEQRGWQLTRPARGETQAPPPRYNSLYEDLFTLPQGAARFIRTYLLRIPARRRFADDPTRTYSIRNEAQLVSWPLTDLFLRKVMHMDKNRIEQIRTLGDALAGYVAEENDSRFFFNFFNTRRYGDLRAALIKASYACLRRGQPPLVSLDGFIAVFEEGVDLPRSDWQLGRDLVLIRMIERLYERQWIQLHTAELPEAEDLADRERQGEQDNL